MIEKFRIILQERIQSIQSHINTATHSFAELHSDRAPDHADIVSINSQGLLNASILTQYQTELRETEYALKKLNEGTFGVCEMCGDFIEEKRLELKPHAKFCIICREIYEKDRK
ncbi:hypothetical protein BBW65_05490 [Helicobacter enhydrae]|uniref:Zinc finger DksA/TraR C4-type domain-containing protein n=2 Tax=Helicobacter enhydrae TaxID=222136 RepID=A0A1B1U7T9_9HELI|nr:hypothetical protein BBW65_05490 [Helicobacter enhydrae]